MKKNFGNRSTFAKLIIKHQGAFFETRCIDGLYSYCLACAEQSWPVSLYNSVGLYIVFVAISNARAPRHISTCGVSVSLSVRLSVTRWYWHKPNDRTITQLSPSGRPGTLVVFWYQLSHPRSHGARVVLLQGLQTRLRWVKRRKTQSFDLWIVMSRRR